MAVAVAVQERTIQELNEQPSAQKTMLDKKRENPHDCRSETMSDKDSEYIIPIANVEEPLTDEERKSLKTGL